MHKVDAMTYEYLIRRVYQVGRFGNDAANADIYRRLERARSVYTSAVEAAHLGQPRPWGKSLEDLEFDYRSRLGEVTGNVSRALAEALKRFSHLLTDQQRQTLAACQDRLLRSSFDDLEDVIGQAEDMLVEAQIFPR